MGVFFLIVFAVSLALTGLSFLFGEIGHFSVDHGAAGIGHGDLGHHALGHDAGGSSDYYPSLANSRVLLAGLTLFGAVGYVVTVVGNSGLLALFAAFGGFVVGAFVMYRGIMVPLAEQQSSYRVSRERFYFLEGNVTDPIPENGMGRVTFVVPGSGALQTEAARSEDGRPIIRGAAVVIVEVNPGSLVVRQQN